MPSIKVNDVTLYYEEQGTGPETVLFVHGLLFNHRMFEAQVEALKAEYRCIAVDLRGQGQSEVTASGYDMDNLTRDTVALIEALDCGPCHFAGLSMGGFIGLRLAINHPHLLLTLSLLDTTSDPEPKENVPKYRKMAWVGRFFGFRPLLGKLLPIMFARDFLTHESKRDSLESWKQQLINNDRRGSSRAAFGVINREGVYDQLGKINIPTLIVVGDQDVATVISKSQRMHDAIAGSELVIIKGAGHSSSIEKPSEINRLLKGFISSGGH